MRINVSESIYVELEVLNSLQLNNHIDYEDILDWLWFDVCVPLT